MSSEESSSSADVYIINRVKELPTEAIKILQATGIHTRKLNQHINVTCNILRFRYPQFRQYYSLDVWNRWDDIVDRMKNLGPSHVNEEIMSVESVEKEAEALLEDIDIDTYRVFDEIGAGSYGAVCAADSTVDGVQVAIKRTVHSSDKQKRKNFQEIRFLKYCAHPNLLKFIRAGEYWDDEDEQNLMLIITEYVIGSTLKSFTDVYNFDQGQIAYMAREILKGLEFMHDNQLAHRDIKPGNIMIDVNGSVKLIDFGLCADISQGELTYMVGSPFWMSPEMIRLEPHGLPTDIFSLGVVLMQVANEERPYAKNFIKAMFVAGTKGYPNPFTEPSQWNNVFHEFLSHCLKIDPKQRFTCKQLLKHAFFKNRCTKKKFGQLISSLVEFEKK